MTTMKKALLAGLAYAAVFVVCALIGSGPAHPQIAPGTPVTVTNKITQPVPSLIVNGSTQPVPVSLSANTAVNLATNAQVGISPNANTVRIGNTAAEPVPVSVQGGSQAQPFQKYQLDGTVDASLTLSWDVPAGKRLVVETLTVTATVPTGLGQTVSVQVTASSQGVPFVTWPTLPFMGTFAGRDDFTGNHPIRLIADDQGGTDDVRFIFTRGVSGDPLNRLIAGAAVTGYLVDLPGGPS